MREIEFRGKRIDNGEWVYGDLLQPTELCYIYEISDKNTVDGSRFEVNPETIGQYTGLKDRNGEKIYEGDIFSLGSKKILYVVKWLDNGFQGQQNGNNSTVGLTYWNSDIEVIGNIYDDPKLLEDK